MKIKIIMNVQLNIESQVGAALDLVRQEMQIVKLSYRTRRQEVVSAYDREDACRYSSLNFGHLGA
jgi:hypothetical protein